MIEVHIDGGHTFASAHIVFRARNKKIAHMVAHAIDNSLSFVGLSSCEFNFLEIEDDEVMTDVHSSTLASPD